MKNVSLKTQVKRLTIELETIKREYLSVVNLNKSNIDKVESLERDKRWLQTLVQELSSSINNGSKEGTFPRR